MTAIEIIITQLKAQIVKSAHHDAATVRTGDYRIGLTKAIQICEAVKEMKLKTYSETRHQINAMQIKWDAKIELFKKLDQSPDIDPAEIKQYKETYMEYYNGIITIEDSEGETAKHSHAVARESVQLALEQLVHTAHQYEGKILAIEIN